jgi:hypothetical protein
MRTNHTYVCTECGKEHAKDWAYKRGHDDDPAICDACFDRQAVVESVKDGVATLRDKRTGSQGALALSPQPWPPRSRGSKELQR